MNQTSTYVIFLSYFWLFFLYIYTIEKLSTFLFPPAYVLLFLDFRVYFYSSFSRRPMIIWSKYLSFFLFLKIVVLFFVLFFVGRLYHFDRCVSAGAKAYGRAGPLSRPSRLPRTRENWWWAERSTGQATSSRRNQRIRKAEKRIARLRPIRHVANKMRADVIYEKRATFLSQILYIWDETKTKESRGMTVKRIELALISH